MAKSAKNTKTRKSLDEMSESHRAHIERWDKHCAAMGVEHVWIGVQRYNQRGVDGPHYVAVKKGDKDFQIRAYDTSKIDNATNRGKVLEDGFETSTALIEAFGQYRQMAREERDKARGKATSAKPKTSTRKKAPASKAKAKVSVKKSKPATRKAAPKRTVKSK